MRMRCSSPSSIEGSRRRRPRPNSCISSSGPNASNTSWRSRVGQLVERELVVVAHEVRVLLVVGLADRLLAARGASGRASCRASARYIACITVKLKSIWTSSPSSPPKNRSEVLGRQVHLAEQHRVAAAPREERTQVAQDLVGVELDVAGDAAGLEEERHGVHAEAVDAELEPEPRDLRDLLAHLRVRDVQVRLVRVEVVEVVLPRLLVPGPDAVLRVGEHDLGLRLGGRLVGPDVVVAERRGGGGSGRAEPRMTVRGVVHDEVDDDPHAAVLRRADQADEVAERAKPLVHAVVVRDVVAVVAIRGGLEGHQPQTADPDPGEVVDPLGEAGQVTGAVPVPVQERLDVEAVDDRVLPPEIARAGGRHDVSSGRTCSANASMKGSCSFPT